MLELQASEDYAKVLPCIRVPKDDKCEFTDGYSRSKDLQATINRLEARVQELENMDSVVMPSVILTRPNSPGPVPSDSPANHAQGYPPGPSGSNSPVSSSESLDPDHTGGKRRRTRKSIASNAFSQHLDRSWKKGAIKHSMSQCVVICPWCQSLLSVEVIARSSDSDHSLLGVQEPPSAMIQMLSSGSIFATRIAIWFFLMHPGRFRASALLQWPLGHAARPSPAILCAAYLWGIHLSRPEPLVSYEAVFIRRTQHHIATELSDSSHPVHRVHTIQAHVLLSTYFLRNNHFLEAEFHTNSAMTLTLGYHLHKIRTSRPSSPPPIGASAFTELFLDPPRNNVEEGERIRGFWTVVCHQNNLIMALQTANSDGILDSPSIKIDTPWPLDIDEYEFGMLLHDLRASDTVHNFVAGGMPGRTSIFALQAQASVLLQQAAQLARKWSPVLVKLQKNG
ncbi:hypothetical protein B0H19DRAFT_1260167 [Mycena capillaripes]|nr:hypothetical protein B0H19DRAFT_1260167 [Mycena capillaripes]